MCKIYHIVHIDRLSTILKSDGLFSDSVISAIGSPGTTIGMSQIKKRRLEECELDSHKGLYVGECVPFYFSPRSVMLYMMYVKSEYLEYKGGQEPIIHLVSDLRTAVNYADHNQLRWAFTSSNAGSYWFEDFSDLNDLSKLNWEAINAYKWRDNKEAKQAEFLVEKSFHWNLIESIGVYDESMYLKVSEIIHHTNGHKPKIEIKKDWYY